MVQHIDFIVETLRSRNFTLHKKGSIQREVQIKTPQIVFIRELAPYRVLSFCIFSIKFSTGDNSFSSILPDATYTKNALCAGSKTTKRIVKISYMRK